MLERQDLRFALIDVGAAQANVLRQAISIKLQSLSPFADFAFCYRAPRASTQLAEVWYWDASALEKRLNQQGSQTASYLVAAAPALIAPLGDGAHVLRWKEGFELQAWQAGQLQRSLFVGQEPHESEWQAFLRDARLKPREMPERASASRVDAGLADRLKFGARTQASSLDAGARGLLVAAALALLGAGAILAATYQHKMRRAIEVAQVELDSVQSRNKESFALEKDISTRAKRSEALASLDPGSSQLALLAHFGQADLLSAQQGVTLGEWEYRNKRLRLSFDAADDTFILADFLRKLESVKVLSNTKLSPESTQRQIILSADLDLSAQAALRDPPPRPKQLEAAAPPPTPAAQQMPLGLPGVNPMLRP